MAVFFASHGRCSCDLIIASTAGTLNNTLDNAQLTVAKTLQKVLNSQKLNEFNTHHDNSAIPVSSGESKAELIKAELNRL